MSTFKRTMKPTERSRAISIHVIPRVAEEFLDEGDLDDHGCCTVDGIYAITIDIPPDHKTQIHDIALEAFHALCSVYEPDDFRFMVSTANPKMDPTPRRDLGHLILLNQDAISHTTFIQAEIDLSARLQKVGT